MRFKDIEEVFAKAFNRTILMLFRPFSIKKWITLGFIALLAGALASGGGGFNFSTPNPSDAQWQEFLKGLDSPSSSGAASQSNPTQSITQSTTQSTQGEQSHLSPPNNLDQIISDCVDPSGSSSLIQTPPGTPQSSQSLGSGGLGSRQAAFSEALFGLAIIGGLLFVVASIFAIIFVWLCSRFSFIFINCVSNNSTAIVAPWREYKKEANSYFGFLLLMVFVGIALLVSMCLGIYYSIPAGLFADPNFSMKSFFEQYNWGVTLGVFLAVAAVWTFVFIIAHYVQQFVLPIMVKDRLSISAAISRFGVLFKSRFWAFLLYIPLAIVLGIICGIIVMIVVILFTLILVLVALIVLMIPGLVFGNSAGFVVYLVLMSIAFMALFVLSALIAGAPVAVFYRAFTLAYLEKIDPHYTLYSADDLTGDLLPDHRKQEGDTPTQLPPQVS
jgi:hypothetical protein